MFKRPFHGCCHAVARLVLIVGSVASATADEQGASERGSTAGVAELPVVVEVRDAEAAAIPSGGPLANFTPMLDLPIDIRFGDSPADPLPPDRSDELFSAVPAPPPRQAVWANRAFFWLPSENRHQPLYFDDVPLERYGQMRRPWLQPALSGVHFFGNLPILPYKMGLDCPWEKLSNLGYHRPGSATPVVRRWLPWEMDAAAIEGIAWTAAVFALP